MTELVNLFEQVKSGVAHIVAVKGQNRAASGSGFLMANRLVTCAHVFRDIPKEHDVIVRFAHSDHAGNNRAFRFTQAEVELSIRGYSEEQSFDYAIFELPIEAETRHNFRFSEENARVGATVAALGYPFEIEHLTMHAGIISSVHKSGPATMIQLDMSVNPSNSGGPLVDPETGRVLGVVSRKATGLRKLFDQLIESFDRNLSALQGLGGHGYIMGVDVVGSMQQTQAQMKQIALEMRKSANVGIGYAVAVAHALQNENALAAA
ncbi:MAG TPA: serine protease [Mesorhizobium sp.]|jgi:S1-C subfamily serine protease|nr:serine protease [Mesorhizobium sp.]